MGYLICEQCNRYYILDDHLDGGFPNNQVCDICGGKLKYTMYKEDIDGKDLGGFIKPPQKTDKTDKFPQTKRLALVFTGILFLFLSYGFFLFSQWYRNYKLNTLGSVSVGDPGVGMMSFLGLVFFLIGLAIIYSGISGKKP